MQVSFCPLCNSTSLLPIPHEVNFLLCDTCNLIFLLPDLRKDPETEKKRYLLHQNDLSNQGYVNFLKKIIKPALPFLNPGMAGLDYGCGPSPVLSEILQTEGIFCENYDPYFYPLILKDKYHFIFSIECFEHFYNPGREILNITRLLLPGGLLMIMTEWWKDLDHFKNWYYKRDFTHVCFYHFSSIKYISKKFGFNILYHDLERVVVLQKNLSS